MLFRSERYLAVIEETIPFRLLSRQEHVRLIWQIFRGSSQEIDQTACVLIDYLNSKPNFFHWFLDALPRLFAAEAHEQESGQPVYLVVPQSLKAWQWDSLRFLGVEANRSIIVPSDFSARGCHFQQLVSTFSHRHVRSSPTGHFDAVSPDSLRQLARRLILGALSEGEWTNKSNRLYVSRGKVNQRRVVNEDAVMDVLAPHGFQRVYCEDLSLQHQIQLFSTASHIIAAQIGRAHV